MAMLVKGSIGLTEITDTAPSAADLITRVETAGVLLSPTFSALEDATKIRLVFSRVDATCNVARETCERALAEAWAYPVFRHKLTEACTPHLRNRLETELVAMQLGTTSDAAGFLRAYKSKLLAAYAAGTPTGQGCPATTERQVEQLMHAVSAAEPALGDKIWQLFFFAGGGEAWSRAAQPLAALITQVADQMRPPGPAALPAPGSTKAAGAAGKPAAAQVKTAQHGAERLETIVYKEEAEELARQLGKVNAEL